MQRLRMRHTKQASTLETGMPSHSFCRPSRAQTTTSKRTDYELNHQWLIHGSQARLNQVRALHQSSRSDYHSPPSLSIEQKCVSTATTTAPNALCPKTTKRTQSCRRALANADALARSSQRCRSSPKPIAPPSSLAIRTPSGAFSWFLSRRKPREPPRLPRQWSSAPVS